MKISVIVLRKKVNKDKENWRLNYILYSVSTVSLMFSRLVAQSGLPRGYQVIEIDIDVEGDVDVDGDVDVEGDGWNVLLFHY